MQLDFVLILILMPMIKLKTYMHCCHIYVTTICEGAMVKST